MPFRILPGKEYSQKDMVQILSEIEDRLVLLELPANAGNERVQSEEGYIVENLAASMRHLDVDTASLDDLRKIVGTIIADLRKVGRLR